MNSAITAITESDKSTSEKITALEDLFKDVLTDDQWHAYMEIEALEGTRLIEEMHKKHLRLKSVLPRYLWPLLALVFSVEPENWKWFEQERDNNGAGYIE